MSRPRGGLITGTLPTWTTTATSGIFTLREAQQMRTSAQWARGPAAPTGLTASAGNTQLNLSWTAPSTTHGTITNYLVEYTPSGGSAAYVLTGSTSTSYTLPGLTNDTAYTVRVAAVNFTAGDYSATATGTPVTVAALTIPVMTSPSAPSGTVLAGGNWINALAQSVSASSNAWRIFSRSGEVYDAPTGTAQNVPVMEPNAFVGYDWGALNRINGYVAYPSTRFAAHFATSINFQGSNDGATWVTLNSRSFGASDWDNDGPVKQTISLGSEATYRMVRWVVGSRTEFARLQVTTS